MHSCSGRCLIAMQVTHQLIAFEQRFLEEHLKYSKQQTSEEKMLENLYPKHQFLIVVGSWNCKNIVFGKALDLS